MRYYSECYYEAMTKIIFENDGPRPRPQTKKRDLFSLIIDNSLGLIKTETQAGLLLIFFAVCILGLSIARLSSSQPKIIHGGSGPSAEELREYSKMQR